MSEARLQDLIDWHLSFPLNANGADTLAALRELLQARETLTALQAVVREVEPYLEHPRSCALIAEALAQHCDCGLDALRAKIKERP